MTSDFCVVGGGIVGLATAMTLLQRYPGADLVLLEKEDRLGVHQTGHNSGVIHSGVYYPPDSFKARLCRAGAAATEAFAAQHGIPFERCGKLLVATTEAERARLDALYERAAHNRVDVQRLNGAELRRIEPNITGVAAVCVPSTGVIDYRTVARAMGRQIESVGGRITLATPATALRETSDSVQVDTPGGVVQAKQVVVCGGLQADRLARLAGLQVDFQIVPFRGEYFRLPAARTGLISRLIYPVPDPALPFLGVHLTRTVDGGVTVGPNAVLGLSREGYRKFSFSRTDVAEYARFPGLWRLASANVRTGARELRNSLFRRGYLAECRKYAPELTVDDLQPEPAGIRAQAVRRDGSLVHDFMFLRTDRTLHVANAPSPAATSALPIAGHIVDQLAA